MKAPGKDGPNILQLTEALEAHFKATELSFDTDRYAIDGLRPGLAVAPSQSVDVAEVLKLAAESAVVVVPWGGGTQQSLGDLPERFDLALDLRRLNRVVEYEPADLTVSVEAGMRISELQQLLGERGQWLPLDPPLPDEATIGGILATNASGPTRHSRGTARDLVIGMSVALANGDIVKSGGRVVKNVAGYEMAKLQIGALGTLGVILQATFKVSPLPQQTLTCGTEAMLDRVVALAAHIDDARLPAQALLLTKEAAASDWTLLVRFAGGTAAVERARNDFLAAASESTILSESNIDAAWSNQLALQQSPVSVKAGVLPVKTSELAAWFADQGADVAAYPAVGIVNCSWTDRGLGVSVLREGRAEAIEYGGSLVIERAPPELKREVDVWGEPPADFALMQRLKREFDPKRTLNRGRFLGGI
jgi:glycolate dehydrogenase FAD-binding subunit